MIEVDPDVLLERVSSSMTVAPFDDTWPLSIRLGFPFNSIQLLFTRLTETIWTMVQVQRFSFDAT
jgi:hypothetical protein